MTPLEARCIYEPRRVSYGRSRTGRGALFSARAGSTSERKRIVRGVTGDLTTILWDCAEKILAPGGKRSSKPYGRRRRRERRNPGLIRGIV